MLSGLTEDTQQVYTMLEAESVEYFLAAAASTPVPLFTPHPTVLSPLSASPPPLTALYFLTPLDPEVIPRLLYFLSQFKTHLQEVLPDSEPVISNHIHVQMVAC